MYSYGSVSARTFVIGDIHGDLEALESLLGKLPILAEDTLVFIGDYVDRGVDSKGVVDLVRDLYSERKERTVLLRGNHEDQWVESYEQADVPFLVQRLNGCMNTYRSFVGQPMLQEEESFERDEFLKYISVSSWLPQDVADWMATLQLWYEDEHGIYVHAGLELDEHGNWKHPADCAKKPLLWMRKNEFFLGYKGKKLVFGHTPVLDLPQEAGKETDPAPDVVWKRGDLIGIDTGCGKGGFLSAVELPSGKVYESR